MKHAINVNNNYYYYSQLREHFIYDKQYNKVVINNNK